MSMAQGSQERKGDHEKFVLNTPSTAPADQVSSFPIFQVIYNYSQLFIKEQPCLLILKNLPPLLD